MTQGLKILRLLMIDNIPFTAVVKSGDLLWLIINSAGYIALGLISFRIFEGVARDRGLLGVY